MDPEAEIIALRGRVSTLEADVKNLVGWQHTQNGALVRMDEKVGGVDNKITNIYKIMIGTAGTAALSFLGTIITLLVILSRQGSN